MKTLIQSNLNKIKNLYEGNRDNNYRKELKEIFGKCFITVSNDAFGVTMITLPNKDRIFIDSFGVEFKPSTFDGFVIPYEIS